MATLIVLIPPRPRLSAAVAGADPGATRTNGDYTFVLSDDGLTAQNEGRCPAKRLPRADTVIAVLDDADASWHRVTVPRVPSGRMRAALGGLLEEALLDDEPQMHLALAPQVAGGQPGWVAAVNKAWLAGELAALEQARVFVDRVVPASWPDEPPIGHFAETHSGGALGGMLLTWADANGVVTLPLKGTLARTMLPDGARRTSRFSASPAAAQMAEQWLGSPVVVMRPGERALMAARSLWNLRQFELASRHRGTRWVGDVWRRLRSPAWRPARVGLAVLAAAHLVGLNVWAWHQKAELASKRDAMTALLRSSFPQVRAVLDAPLQMQRETDALRAGAGRVGDADLEPLLEAAAAAWPKSRPAVDTLRYETGRLTLAAPGWTAEETSRFSEQLRSEGWRVEAGDGRFVLSRAAPGVGA
jgi:general secretion pathway protein L